MVIFERLHNHVRVVCVRCKLNSAIVLDDGDKSYAGRLEKIGWWNLGGSDRKFTCPVCLKHLFKSWGVPYRKTRQQLKRGIPWSKYGAIVNQHPAAERARQYDPPSIN
jgi:hypothetical protein